MTETTETTAKRKRQGNVRGLILGLLESGPKASAELAAKGGFSPAAAFLNLRALRGERLITAERRGRAILFSLAAGGVSGNVAAGTPRRRGRPAKTAAPGQEATVVAYLPASLHEALNGLSQRLAPIEALDQKMMTLERLAATLPGPIATMLNAISDDLQRVVSASQR